MKKLNILKALTNYVWYISIILAIPVLILALLAIFNNDDWGVPIKVNGVEVELIDWKSNLVLILLLASFYLLVAMLYYFRKVLALFSKKDFFNLEVAKNFNKMGLLIIISAFLNGTSDFANKMFSALNGKKSLNFEIGDHPFLYLLALGMFCLVLGEVFETARSMKEENELTV